jgi:hypothetical protein
MDSVQNQSSDSQNQVVVQLVITNNKNATG